MKTFSILGCGFLGLGLVKQLQKSYIINIATRSKLKAKEFSSCGFNSYVLFLNNYQYLKEFLDCDILFISLPPKDENYIFFLEHIYKNILNKTKVIFISSTSIYPQKDLIFTESFYIKNDDFSLVNKAERVVKKRSNIIFRSAGLMGENRIPGKYFSNKEVKNYMQKVNYVHKDDLISVIVFALDKNLEGIYNVCALEHPRKKEIYTKNAKKYNFKEPIFNSSSNENKNINRIISSSKLCKEGFEYIYSKPLFLK